MINLRSRPRAAALRAHASLSAALLCCFALPLSASAQDAAPDQEAIKLPEVLIEQPAVTPPAKKGAKKSAKKSPSAPAQVQPASPVVDLAVEPTGGNALANRGTPAAGVEPMFGKAGSPAAQTATGIDTAKLDNEPLFSVNDLLRQSPGVSLKQGNGPRDYGISIRGSNARNGFGIRNIVIFEDGFPVTQPDGLSRSDLVDPHAYGGVDVWRGPSSAMFGNYATGGALNFRTRRGGEIDGIEHGSDIGSFNCLNNYVTAGTRGQAYEASIFMSDVRGDGHYAYSDFDTQTVNMLLTYQATPQDKVTIKGINNDLYAELPFRMSLNEFNQNPFQQGCLTKATAAPGCVLNNFSATNTNPRVPQTAQQAGANRDDRRTIGGVRWEHDFNADTSSRLQFVIDDRNISQPTGPTSAVGDFLSYNVVADINHRAMVAGLPTTYLLGAYWNHLPVDSYSYNVAPGGGAALGKLQSNTRGATTNFGARAREEVTLADGIVVAAGIAVERTWLDGGQRSFTYTAAGAVQTERFVAAERTITNVAPEIGLLWKPDAQWQYRARVGTGYGTPQFTNLFVTPDGMPGNNTELQSQENVGYDVGVDWTPVRGVMLSLTGFYEFFENELVSQSAGPGKPSYSFNAPRSEHRGAEFAADVTIVDGLRLTAAYLYNDQIYTEYAERLSGLQEPFNRAGNKIPGVSPHELTARISYDETRGLFKGVGGFIEYQWHDAFFMENANLLQAPGYDVVDLNVHYASDLGSAPLRSFMAYFEIRNLLDETYISAANNITDTVGATPATLAKVSGSIYAGAPRTYYGGFKVKF